MRKLLDIIETPTLNGNFLLQFEARRNPELNKKISAIDALKKYAGRKDVFVSFTDDVGSESHQRANSTSVSHNTNNNRKYQDNIGGAKLGLNPASEFKTPIGIYGYPLKHILDVGIPGVEFGNDRPYIWVFLSVGNLLDLETYNDSDLQRDIEKLGKLGRRGMNQVMNAIDTAKVKTPGCKIWNVTRLYSREHAKMRLETEASNIFDRERDAAFQEYLRYNGYDRFQDENEDGTSLSDHWEEFIQTYDSSPEGPNDTEIDLLTSRIWNQVFRKLGYDGVADFNGAEIIHENEPTQAVFFSKSAIKEIEVIRNIDPMPAKMSDVKIWKKNPKVLQKLILQGKVGDDKLFQALYGDLKLFDSISWDSLPNSVKNRCRNEISHFIGDRHNAEYIRNFDLSDAQMIELLRNYPRYVTGIDNASDHLQEWILKNIIYVARYFPDVALSEDKIIQAIVAHPGLTSSHNMHPLPEFLQDYFIQHDPEKLLEYYRDTTMTARAILVCFEILVKHNVQECFGVLDASIRLNDNLNTFFHCAPQLSSKDFSRYLRCSNSGYRLFGDNKENLEKLYKMFPDMQKK